MLPLLLLLISSHSLPISAAAAAGAAVDDDGHHLPGIIIDSSTTAVDQLLLFRGSHSFPLRASDAEVFIGSSYAVSASDESLPLSISATDIDSSSSSSLKESCDELSNEFQLIRPDRIVDLRTIGTVGEGTGNRRLGTSSATAAAEAVSVYNITDITPVVIDNNDVVTVYFESSNPQSNDWIGR